MLGALVGLVLGVLLLLAMPFDIAFRLNTQERIRPRVTIGWAFGLVSKELSSQPDATSTVPPIDRLIPQAQPANRHGKAAIAFLRSPGMPARLYKLGLSLGRQLHIRQLRLHLTFGLGDSADTGRLLGALSPAVVLMRRCSRLDLRVQPDFTESILIVDSQGQFRVFPLAIVGVMIGFFFSPACWRAMAVAIRRK